MASVEKRRIEMPDADVVLFPAFFSSAQSDLLLESLTQKLHQVPKSKRPMAERINLPTG
jgi:hypothetical protein